MVKGKTIFLLFLIVLLCGLTHAQELFIITIDEHGKVISYYDEYFIVQVNGTFSMYNGYNSTMYSVRIPLDLDTLSLFQRSEGNYISPNGVEVLMFEPFETITFDYEIRGITATDPMKDNHSVMSSRILWDQISFHAMLRTSIRKAEIEKADINTTSIISIAERRLVTLTVENPSEIAYNITDITVIKTLDQDPNDDIASWHVLESQPYMILQPHEVFTQDILDYDSHENEVYWLKVDTQDNLRTIINDTHDVSRFDQDDLFNPENLSIDALEELRNVTAYLEHLLYAKKSYSKTHISPGDVIDVDILVNNYAPIARNITVTDYLPLGFSVIGEPFDKVDVSWQKTVNPEASIKISYQLNYSEEEMVGIDYFEPAMIEYEGEKIFTRRTPFVRKFIPDKKVFIQKTIRSSINDLFVVDLTVQNVGDSRIYDLYVKEFLTASDEYNELTKVPVEKGLWLIDELHTGGTWEVSYITGQEAALTTLPEVFGIDKQVVLKSLVFENVIRSEWIHRAMANIEWIGLTVILLLVVVFVPANRLRRRIKERRIHSLGKKVHNLKDATTPDSSDNIEYLREESKKGLNLPDDIKMDHYDIGSDRSSAHNNLDKLHELRKKSEGK